MITVRRAEADDSVVLGGIDLSTWSSHTSAVSPPLRYSDYRFFGERTRPRDVLVAESGRVQSGYVRFLGLAHFPPTRAHVLEITGLAVDPHYQRTGVGRRLVEAAVEEAGHRGARKVVLRVLGCNERARRLFDRCGFEIEAFLRDEYLIDGRYVDELWLARHIGT